MITRYRILFFLLLFSLKGSAQDGFPVADSFSFIFMTDIHVQPEMGAAEGFKIAIDTANKLDADFVLTGGDLVYDALRGNFPRSDSLFRLYKRLAGQLNKPVYHCLGNHELFGIYPESDVDSTHPDYKYGMFERHLGPSYYSFDHKGWHFIVLNSLEVDGKKYIGYINEPQIKWLTEDLKSVNPNTPVVVMVHIPLFSMYREVYPGKRPVTEVPNNLWIANRDEVMEVFKDHNLRLVLQGHMHWLEDLNIQDRFRVITGGSIAGRPSWRRVDDRGDGVWYSEEGFLLIHVKGEHISWDYIDIGWESYTSRNQ